jgi:hypothetical protein
MSEHTESELETLDSILKNIREAKEKSDRDAEELPPERIHDQKLAGKPLW